MVQSLCTCTHAMLAAWCWRQLATARDEAHAGAASFHADLLAQHEAALAAKQAEVEQAVAAGVAARQELEAAVVAAGVELAQARDKLAAAEAEVRARVSSVALPPPP